ncbi:hypothetical protein niasHT_030267 [Heterodera trifolii]|uniref:Nuclear pore complex protein n=1 Tax=Heterodera trifolii TaxID=157864 RepID=A0ABD2JFK6_9BILA
MDSSIYTTEDISGFLPADAESSFVDQPTKFANINNSMYTTDDVSEMFSSDSTANSRNENLLMGLQFLDRNDLLTKLSRMIFEDFHNNLSSLKADDSQEDVFLDMLQRFLEVCESGVKGIEKICSDGPIDPHSDAMMDKLSLERSAYALMLKMAHSNQLINDNEQMVSTSFLTNLFRLNDQFRRISTLLLWSEENALFSQSEFAKITEQNVEKLSHLDNIYACTRIRCFVHIDSRFVDRIAAEDEEAVQTLNRMIFSLLRTGRLDDAKILLANVKLPAFAAFISIREFLTNPRLSPTDIFDEMHDFARNRLFFKQTARELVPVDDDRVQKSDQCIWATFGGDLATLLSHALSTEDRLWAYLSCAAEALLDEELLKEHKKKDGELMALATDIQRREGMDLPKDVHAIFAELRNNESRPYYTLFEHLALERWDFAVRSIGEYFNAKKEGQIAADELRFFVHLVILLRLSGKCFTDLPIFDALIEQYSKLLQQMRLITIVPFYLYHLSPEKSTEKMLDFLMKLTFVSEQKEVLENAIKIGFDVPNLCRDVYRRFKDKHNFGPNIAREALRKAAEELILAWKWLAFCETETVWDAIIEANFLLRKFFLYGLMSEALQLMQLAPEKLPEIALRTFQTEFPDKEIPTKLKDAQREFDCYQLYFEAISRYTEWQNHVEGNRAPELPTKLSDERWARMDIRRRTEYELSVQKARDCLQKYYRLVELYKKRAIEILEVILKMSDGWLVTIPLRDEDLADEEIVERAEDFVRIRKDYLASLLQKLIDIYHRSDMPMSVLDTATLIMDPIYCLYKALDKEKLQKLLKSISQAGASLL